MREHLYPHDKLMAVTIIPLIPKFVTPNAVTILRFLLTPLVVYYLVVENYNIGIPLFIFTAFTDVIDGSLARLRKKITVWGTLFDPVADKLLIGSSIAVLVVRYLHPLIAVIIIMMESVFLTGGWAKKRRGIIESPSWYGKVKMFFQSAGVTLLLFAVHIKSGALVLASTIAFLAAILLGVMNVIKHGIQL